MRTYSSYGCQVHIREDESGLCVCLCLTLRLEIFRICFVVADGMGGHNAGDYASSRHAVERCGGSGIVRMPELNRCPSVIRQAINKCKY